MEGSGVSGDSFTSDPAILPKLDHSNEIEDWRRNLVEMGKKWHWLSRDKIHGFKFNFFVWSH